MQIHILTIFPKMFDSVFAESIVAKAVKTEKLQISIYNLRDWTTDNYQSVDDHPYGGGAGMVMKIEPLYKALKDIKKNLEGPTKIIITSAKGKTYKQSKAVEYSQLNHLIIVCGHYEGIDERIIQNFADEEVSIGNYVLSGGEAAAIVITDSIARLLPEVLGNSESLKEESFNDDLSLEYPHYTKPSVFVTDEGQEFKVPEVLLNGNHKEIEKWRVENSKKLL
jgi:tRNA (guanine37-N1)-methyltransferase